MEQWIFQVESRRGHKVPKEGDRGVTFWLAKEKVILMDRDISLRASRELSSKFRTIMGSAMGTFSEHFPNSKGKHLFEQVNEAF
jgi:hypothetical protein